MIDCEQAYAKKSNEKVILLIGDSQTGKSNLFSQLCYSENIKQP